MLWKTQSDIFFFLFTYYVAVSGIFCQDTEIKMWYHPKYVYTTTKMILWQSLNHKETLDSIQYASKFNSAKLIEEQNC